MQIMTKTVLKDSKVPVSNHHYISRPLGSDIEIENCYHLDNSSTYSLSEVLKRPHPLIHTWMVLSSISICFLSALFFIIF